MKVLMLGWEFPPYFTGGLGTVCYALTKALSRRNHEVTYMMPKGPLTLKQQHGFLKLKIAEHDATLPKGVKIREISSLLIPYAGYSEYDTHYMHYSRILGGKTGTGKVYGENLLLEVRRFAAQALALALEEEFDVIHAHDWMTFPAGIAIQEATGKPLLVHIHITEFDKSGGNHADPRIYAIEREGMQKADTVIALSNFIKNRCVENYGCDPKKIRVIHNAVEFDEEGLLLRECTIKPHEKIVLFLGRITLQKGPDYFLEAARKVATLDPDVKFIMAGTGDMLPRMIERAAELGLGNRVFFPGFVSREQADQLYRMADVFVMPSVSEPFGLVPLEAISQGTPAIISKQSGVSEILRNALKVDFWDIDELTNKITAALNYGALHDTLKQHGVLEIKSFTWDTPAEECVRTYDEARRIAADRKGWHKGFGGYGTLHQEVG